MSDEVHIDTEDAAGGSKEKVVRYVLAISMLAAIVLLSAIWIFGAATQGDDEEEVNVTNTMIDDTAMTEGEEVLIQGDSANGAAGAE